MGSLQDYMSKLLFGAASKALETSAGAVNPPEPFDPYGSGYDYETAKQFGLGPDKTGHWPSRVPGTGMLLKGLKHESWPLTMQAEQELGNKIIFKDGRYYSIPDTSQKKQMNDMSPLIEALKLWKGFNVK
jgi:hypothetical protein